MWTIEYWKNQGKKVECFSSADGTWLEAPNDNVLYVYVERPGILPHGDPGKIYTTRYKDWDKYYMYEPGDGSVWFGGYNLMTASEHSGLGSVVKCFLDGSMEGEAILGGLPSGPQTIPGGMIKNGIWLSEPWAGKVGLSGPYGPREIPGCVSYMDY
jgi:hypothetical protein